MRQEYWVAPERSSLVLELFSEGEHVGMNQEVGVIGSDIVLGMLAGALGTAAMTAGQTLEMKLTGCKGSKTPALAAEKVFDIDPESQRQEQRVSNRMHWLYGTALATLCPPHHPSARRGGAESVADLLRSRLGRRHGAAHEP
jgi:hypothetical protein